MKILILGVTGMLGHILFEQLMKDERLEVYATARSADYLYNWVPEPAREKLILDVDANNYETIVKVMETVRPQMVINCIGIIKHLPVANDPILGISINSLLPHKISLLCKSLRSRMIHISTDCIFDGKRGNYKEDESSNADDFYGRTKYLGEVGYEPHCVTIRTSIIGHELKNKYGLIDWFLAQKIKVRGFTNAIYTGFPTIEMVRIMRDFIIPNPLISGIYNVSSDPISKHELLKLVAGEYDNNIEIEPYDDFKINRSLNSDRFRGETGYKPPAWKDMIKQMHEHYAASVCYR